MIVRAVAWAKNNIGFIYCFRLKANHRRYVQSGNRRKRRDSDLFKWGVSLSPRQRFKQVKQSLPREDRKDLVFVDAKPVFGPYAKEKGHLHVKFKDCQWTPVGIGKGGGGKEFFENSILQYYYGYFYLRFYFAVFILTWTLPVVMVTAYWFLITKPELVRDLISLFTK